MKLSTEKQVFSFSTAFRRMPFWHPCHTLKDDQSAHRNLPAVVSQPLLPDAAGSSAERAQKAGVSAAMQVVLFDVQQRSTIAELSTPFIKYCVWSGDMGHVALLSKHAIIIANKRLGNSCTGQRARLLACRLSVPPGGAQHYENATFAARFACCLVILSQLRMRWGFCDHCTVSCKCDIAIA